MTVRVHLFASYADAFGTPRLDLELPAGATVADLLAEVRKLPSAARLAANPMVALNHEYAEPGQVIGAGDEVAIIPPVAGG
ncbi:MAG: thiamine protein [Gemmatimonadetes bacterium]|nr:thiamine protein [Gemmatimonadota bacterium]